MAKQVLVVDDDRNAVKYLTVVLSEHGYDTVPAYDGSEALEKIKRAKPDLIVLDVMMPKKSGFVLFKQLQMDEKYKGIPVLMATGVDGVLEGTEGHEEEPIDRPYDSIRAAMKKKIRELRREGLVRPEMFMDKPIDPDLFIAKVKQLIGS